MHSASCYVHRESVTKVSLSKAPKENWIFQHFNADFDYTAQILICIIKIISLSYFIPPAWKKVRVLICSINWSIKGTIKVQVQVVLTFIWVMKDSSSDSQTKENGIFYHSSIINLWCCRYFGANKSRSGDIWGFNASKEWKGKGVQNYLTLIHNSSRVLWPRSFSGRL